MDAAAAEPPAPVEPPYDDPVDDEPDAFETAPPTPAFAAPPSIEPAFAPPPRVEAAFVAPPFAAPAFVAPPFAPPPPRSEPPRAPSTPPRAIPSEPPRPTPMVVTEAIREAMASWEPIVVAIGATRPALGAVLAHAIPQVVNGERLAIAFPKSSFYAKQAGTAESQAAIMDIAERRLGSRPKLEIVELGSVTYEGPTIAKLEDERRRARLDAARKKALNHPIVVEALLVFDAKDRPVDVRIDGE
jgi:hypothetical protein